MAFEPVEILVEEGLQESSVALRARRNAPKAVVGAFRDLTALMGRLEGMPPTEAKKRLVVARRAGGFVKEFPEGPGIRKSGWRYFIPAIGCPADCRYCFLQTYHPANTPIVFAEQEAMLAEIEAKAVELGGGYFYGGELCDDLMLERFAEVTEPLVGLFRRLPNATLELRTKSDEVAPLLAAGGAPNVVISWTFSPREVVERFELGTATVENRIGAAAAAQKAGFRVGIRMDPVILTEGWREAYMTLVEHIAAALDPAMVESVHIGALRFTPGLKAAVTARHGRGAPLADEFVMSSDSKYRYPRPIRSAGYGWIAELIRAWDDRIRLRLCMETPAVEAVLKARPV